MDEKRKFSDCIDTESLFCKKASFNHKHLTPNQYSDTYWVQNEFTVYNLHLRTGFCEI